MEGLDLFDSPRADADKLVEPRRVENTIVDMMHAT